MSIELSSYKEKQKNILANYSFSHAISEEPIVSDEKSSAQKKLPSKISKFSDDWKRVPLRHHLEAWFLMGISLTGVFSGVYPPDFVAKNLFELTEVLGMTLALNVGTILIIVAGITCFLVLIRYIHYVRKHQVENLVTTPQEMARLLSHDISSEDLEGTSAIPTDKPSGIIGSSFPKMCVWERKESKVEQPRPRFREPAGSFVDFVASKSDDDSSTDDMVLVIGAGLSGTFAALEAGKKHKVLLVEQSDGVIPESSSSVNECYKLHTGMHYAGDSTTALKILEASVAFARSIPPDCMAGEGLDSPSRRGRHFVMSDSLFNTAQVCAVAIRLQKRYQQLILEDPRNKIFGEPENFIKFLEEKDYPYIAKSIPSPAGDSSPNIKVELGIETGESQVDIGKLRNNLEKEIKSNENIMLVLNTKVTYIAPLIDRLGYVVTVQDDKGRSKTHNVAAVINCAWQNIEKIDQTIGFYAPDENRVIRIKVCIRVKLPPSLHKINTAIFSIGPYCSFTNLGNGEAVLASEVTTNLGFYKAGGECPKALSEQIKNEGKLLGEKIRKECAQYFENSSELMEAPIEKIMVGYVKMMHIDKEYNSESLFKQESPIHQREEPGVEVRDLCYISVSGNKMTYTQSNSVLANEILNEHFLKRDALSKLINLIKPRVKEALKKMGKNYTSIIDSILHVTCKNIFLSEKNIFSCEDDRTDFSKYNKKYLEFITTEIIKTIQQKEGQVSNILQLGFLKNGGAEKMECKEMFFDPILLASKNSVM